MIAEETCCMHDIIVSPEVYSISQQATEKPTDDNNQNAAFKDALYKRHGCNCKNAVPRMYTKDPSAPIKAHIADLLSANDAGRKPVR